MKKVEVYPYQYLFCAFCAFLWLKILVALLDSLPARRIESKSILNVVTF